MNVSSNLYISDSLKKKQNRILAKIKKAQKVLSLFCVTNASNCNNLLDIYYYNEFFQKASKQYLDVTIYGVAKTKEEAFKLVEQMVNDCLQARGDCDVRQFLKQ